MGHERFTYTTHKNGLVRIVWEGRCVMEVGGKRGQKLARDLAAADDTETQRLLQRVTGNFRRGNEREGKRTR
jgi:hypothetical protein